MKQFKTIDREACREIRKLIDSHLAAISDVANLKITGGNMSFSATTATIKLEIGLVGVDGSVGTKMGADFTRYADSGAWEGITGSDLGRTLPHAGNTITIVGAKPRSHKYPILVEYANGKQYKYPAATIARAIKAADEKELTA